MARTVLVRGMLAGVLAGLVALLFALIFGEPQVGAAIRLEEAHAAADSGQAAPVSRAVQSTLGLGLATVVLGVAVGGVYGLAFGFLNGRLRGLDARATALLLGVIGFVAVALLPGLKYPANPPGVESTLDMGARTALYAVMVLISVLAAIGALISAGPLVTRWGAWHGATLAVLGYLLVVGISAALLRDSPARIEGFPADLLWSFRMAALGTQAALWLALGLIFGALTDRAAKRGRAATTPAGVST